MQSFRTEIKIEKAVATLGMKGTVLTIGSCFSDTIGTKLAQHKINTLVNPFGTIYNPYSIHKSLRVALNNAYPASHSYWQHNELYAHSDFHSEFSAPEKAVVEENVKATITNANKFLKTAHWIILTYGTAFVYKRNDTGDIVANCHKVPLTNFTKELLSEKKVVDSFEGFYQNLKAVNPSCRIILTVSPVRHSKETMQLNGVSKSILRVACQTLTDSHPDVFYFPAYEIMLDDLRDYRFYKSDMLHPSDEAEEYIWNKFSEYLFDDPTKVFLKKWASIYSSLQHRPFHTKTEAHKKFLTKLLSELEELNKTIRVEKEILTVKSQLKHES